MKNTRRLASLLLALVMVFAMATTAFADGETTEPTTGSITITNAKKGENYWGVRVFDAIYSAAGISYRVKEGWSSPQSDYFTVDAAGNVSATDAAKDNDGNLTAGAITWIAQYVQTNSTTNQSGDFIKVPEADGSLTIDKLPFGYYYIATSTGTVVTVDSTNPNATVEDKNDAPGVVKKIVEDDKLVDENTASIGDKVYYRVTVTSKATVKKLALHDTMSAGLTFNNDVKIMSGETEITDFTVVTPCSDCNCTFKIDLSKYAGQELVITYSATLNENAVIAGAGNPNEADLTYGNAQRIDGTPVITKTFSVGVVKTDSANNLLAGAEFKLYADEACEQEIKLAQVDSERNGYRPAVGEETPAEAIVTTEAGSFWISGLGNGTYYLKETKAPAGYNQLADPVKIEINSANIGNVELKDGKYVSGGIQVINNAGSEMPGTGGMGTTLFYVFGSIMVLAAVVLLVTKKRMAVE